MTVKKLGNEKTAEELISLLQVIRLFAITRTVTDPQNHFARSIVAYINAQLGPEVEADWEKIPSSDTATFAEVTEKCGETTRDALNRVLCPELLFKFTELKSAAQVVLDQAFMNLEDERETLSAMEIFCKLIIQKFPPLLR